MNRVEPGHRALLCFELGRIRVWMGLWLLVVAGSLGFALFPPPTSPIGQVLQLVFNRLLIFGAVIGAGTLVISASRSPAREFLATRPISQQTAWNLRHALFAAAILVPTALGQALILLSLEFPIGALLGALLRGILGWSVLVLVFLGMAHLTRHWGLFFVLGVFFWTSGRWALVLAFDGFDLLGSIALPLLAVPAVAGLVMLAFAARGRPHLRLLPAGYFLLVLGLAAALALSPPPLQLRGPVTQLVLEPLPGRDTGPGNSLPICGQVELPPVEEPTLVALQLERIEVHEAGKKRAETAFLETDLASATWRASRIWQAPILSEGSSSVTADDSMGLRITSSFRPIQEVRYRLSEIEDRPMNIHLEGRSTTRTASFFAETRPTIGMEELRYFGPIRKVRTKVRGQTLEIELMFVVPGTWSLGQDVPSNLADIWVELRSPDGSEEIRGGSSKAFFGSPPTLMPLSGMLRTFSEIKLPISDAEAWSGPEPATLRVARASPGVWQPLHIESGDVNPQRFRCP